MTPLLKPNWGCDLHRIKCKFLALAHKTTGSGPCLFACLPLILGHFLPAFLTSSHCFSDSCWNAFFAFCLGALKTVKKKLQLKWSREARRGRSHALGQQWQSPPARRKTFSSCLARAQTTRDRHNPARKKSPSFQLPILMPYRSELECYLLGEVF